MPVDLTGPIRQWLPTAIYAGAAPHLPRMVLGRLPEPVSISVGRAFKGWIIESDAEMAALGAALDRPIPQPEPGRLNFKSGPDATCAAASEGAPFIVLHAPPVQGWPWLVLTALPPDAGRRTKIQRDRYIWETHAGEDDARAAVERLKAEWPQCEVHRPQAQQTATSGVVISLR